MVALGLLLLALGVLMVLAAIFSSSGTASFLGMHLTGSALFFLGVASTLAVLCGLVLTRAGTGRAIRLRRDSRRLRSIERERRRAADAGSATETAGEQPNDEPPAA